MFDGLVLDWDVAGAEDADGDAQAVVEVAVECESEPAATPVCLTSCGISLKIIERE